MTNTTTQHIRALLVDDGHEFAMIRKTDLAALMQITETDPHLGRYLDPIGAHKAEIKRLEVQAEGFRRLRSKSDLIALKHGEERRRYMANNKALLAHADILNDDLSVVRQNALGLMGEASEWRNRALSLASRVCVLEAAMFRLKRKFPAVCAWLGFVK